MTRAKTVVLVVEDEPLLRMAAVDMLEDAGFGVIEAFNAAIAIRHLEARSDICVVFTDIDMPGGMDGIGLATLIRTRWPPIELIITSGKVTPASSKLPARSVFFSKPFKEREVVAAVQKMVA